MDEQEAAGLTGGQCVFLAENQKSRDSVTLGRFCGAEGKGGPTREVGKGCAGSPRSFLCLGGAGPVVHVRVPGLFRAHGVHLRLSDPNYG